MVLVRVCHLDALAAGFEQVPEVRQYARADRAELVRLLRPVAERQLDAVVAVLVDVRRRLRGVPCTADPDVRAALDDHVALPAGLFEQSPRLVDVGLVRHQHGQGEAGPLVLGGVVGHVALADRGVRDDEERVVEGEHLGVPERDVVDEPPGPVVEFDHVADLVGLVREDEQAVDDAPDDGREDDTDHRREHRHREDDVAQLDADDVEPERAREQDRQHAGEFEHRLGDALPLEAPRDRSSDEPDDVLREVRPDREDEHDHDEPPAGELRPRRQDVRERLPLGGRSLQERGSDHGHVPDHGGGVHARGSTCPEKRVVLRDSRTNN